MTCGSGLNGHGVADPADGDRLGDTDGVPDGGGLSVGEPVGVGDWVGRGGCDELGDLVGLGAGPEGLGVEEGLVAGWTTPAGAGTGRTRMYSASTARNRPLITSVEVRGRPLMRHPRSPGRSRDRPTR